MMGGQMLYETLPVRVGLVALAAPGIGLEWKMRDPVLLGILDSICIGYDLVTLSALKLPFVYHLKIKLAQIVHAVRHDHVGAPVLLLDEFFAALRTEVVDVRLENVVAADATAASGCVFKVGRVLVQRGAISLAVSIVPVAFILYGRGSVTILLLCVLRHKRIHMMLLQQMSDYFLMIRVTLVAEFTAQPLRLRQMAEFVGAK